ncbi:MAG: Fe-S cluster assembly ATPase SufC [Gammaproteobacteria bacterium]|nr:Fe-S cluster assembly ATPase SufC [Gammaproteobacteria bacterium]
MNKTPRLNIQNLQVAVKDKSILKGLNLTIYPGEVHAIMGPNGAGKSSLSNVLAGREGYTLLKGSVELDGESILELSPEERALKGLFLGMQYPVEIPGVNNVYFLKAAVNAVRKSRGEPEIDAMDFMQLAKQTMKLVGMDEKFLNRGVNEGFSGGEKKRNEILQMLLLQPKFAILDETDSGLDIDALQTVASGINHLRDQNRSFLLITHYQRLLNYVEPDYVHVMIDGVIVKSGDKSLALELEAKGYGWLQQGKS